MKVIFLTGSMGSGKSSILKKSTLIGRSRFIQYCQEYDILGADKSGADTLSKYNKNEVLSSLVGYKGQKLVVAGEYYSKQIDLKRFKEMGFQIYVILLNVSREEIYRRVLARGSGSWNEKTYETNIKNRVAFYKSHTGRKWIMDNSDEAQQTKVINRILGI